MKKEFFNQCFEFGGTVGNLHEDKGNYNGIYMIVLPDNFGKIGFEKQSKLKIWRGEEVSVPVETLQEKWVENAEVLYIGKCSSKTKTAKKLVLKHIAFWNGKNVSAYGGKVIGQIQNFDNLQVWYLECDNPSQMKDRLLNAFEEQYGNLPFANWQH